MAKTRADLLWVFAIAVAGFFFHILTYHTLGFHRDELLYLSLGQHLSPGYWSNPPLIGYIARLAEILPGNPLFTTRLLPALAGGILTLLTGLIARELGGNRYAQILSCLVLSFSLLFLRAYSMLQPVPFDILLWTVTLYFFLKYINTERPSWMILTGVATGLGLLNKYMMVFLAAGIFIAMLITPYRRLLLKGNTWMAVAAGFLLFLPNILWQYVHGFPVIQHMQELRDTQLVNVERINIVLEQILMFTFGSVIWMAGLIWLLRSKENHRFRIFAWIYMAVLTIFMILKGKPYYAAGLYPFMLAAGGVAWENIIRRTRFRIAFTVIILLFCLPLVPGGIPLMSGEKLAAYFSKIPPKMGGEALLRWEDGKMHPLPQDYADMLGWDELGKLVINACDTIHDKNRIFIYAENYGQAGAIDLYGRHKNLPPVASFSDSYLLWMPDSLKKGADLFFYVNDEPGEDIIPLFEKLDTVGSIRNPLAREYGTTVYLFRSPKPEFAGFLASKVREVKSHRFGR